MPEMPEKKLTVSASPHVRSAQTVSGIMLNVIIALIPALAASVWLFGPRVLLICLVTIGTCMLSEYLSRKIMKRSNTLGDLSAVVTGLLLAFNLPVSIPLWQAAIGSVIAIVPDRHDNMDKAPLVARQGRRSGHHRNAPYHDDKGRRAL